MAKPSGLGSQSTRLDFSELYPKVTTGPTSGQDEWGTLIKVKTHPLSSLLNLAAACYLDSVVTGLWCAREADDLSEDHWTTFFGTFATNAGVSHGGGPPFCQPGGNPLVNMMFKI